MLETQFIAYVAERDIDLLLLEEFSVSDEFRKWFSSRAAEKFEYLTSVGVWHSIVGGTLGESDIVFVYKAQSGERIAILIENKIDALPQPDQAARYRQRGESGTREARWEQFKTCAVAPQRYLDSSKHDKNYDVEISYEELSSYFTVGGSENLRGAYKASIIQEAIEQNRRGYQAEYCPTMTTFVADYFAIAVQNFPELKMQEAKQRPSGSTWVTFNPSELPRGAYICHQLSAGAVKLFLSHPNSLESVLQAYGPHVPSEVTIEQAGKSVALIVKVPKIDPLKLSVVEQNEEVLFGLNAATQLLKVVQRVAASNRSSQA